MTKASAGTLLAPTISMSSGLFLSLLLYHLTPASFAAESYDTLSTCEILLEENRVSIATRADLNGIPEWNRAFHHLRKDNRFYEITEDTICPEMTYKYFVIRDGSGHISSIQPFFLLNQDLLGGSEANSNHFANLMRKFWPGFLTMKTLMVGCTAGEGHLQASDPMQRQRDAKTLAINIIRLSREQNASLVVLKEFPAEYRTALKEFTDRGFTRIPSMPMTRLDISQYSNFDDFVMRAVKGSRRAKLRRNLKTADAADPPITSEMPPNLEGGLVDEIYPLYEQVYERSPLKFEKLTKEYFLELGRQMPEKTRFFIWRKNGKAVAFGLFMIEGETLYAEYLGLDYTFALDLHLYFYVMRDSINWAIANGFKAIGSSSLGYKPKLTLGHRLAPIDLYVSHTSPLIQPVLKRALPWMDPTRGDETLQKFPNFKDLIE